MIDRKYAIRYLVRQSQRTIYCAMGPKSFRAVKARKATSGAVKDTKSNTSVVLQEDFFRL